jgi:hypothetical protein
VGIIDSGRRNYEDYGVLPTSARDLGATISRTRASLRACSSPHTAYRTDNSASFPDLFAVPPRIGATATNIGHPNAHNEMKC